MGNEAHQASEHICTLAREIGPRPAGSEHERQAGEWLAERFRLAGLETSVQEFTCPPTFAHPLFALICAALVMAAMVDASPITAMLGGLVVLSLFVAECMGLQTVSRLRKQVTSHNVIGRIPPHSGRALQTVVVTAHLDSAYGGLAFAPALVGGLRVVFVGLMVALAAVPIAALLRYLSVTWWPFVCVPAALHLLWGAVLLGHQAFVARPVPGAGDNASGVAVLALLAAKPIECADTEVLLVGTGAEEAGLYGMMALLRWRDFDRDTTRFLNLDNVGAGPIRIIAREGLLVLLSADAGMVEQARAAAEDLGMDAPIDTYRTLPVESSVPLMRGCRALSLVGSLEHWHQHSDVPEAVDPEVPAAAAALVRGIVERFDAAEGRSL